MFFAAKKVYVNKKVDDDVEFIDDEVMERNIEEANFDDMDMDDIDMEMDMMVEDHNTNVQEVESSRPSSVSGFFSSIFGGSSASNVNTTSNTTNSSIPQSTRRSLNVNSDRKESAQKRVRRVQKQVKSTNTNVVSVELKCIGNHAEIMTGDPTQCLNCGACFSSLSKIVSEGHEQVWNCEYCETSNTVFIENEEIPTTQTVDYLIKPADSKDEVSEETIIFVVDISGSMCVTTEIDGKHSFKKGKIDAEAFGGLNVGNQYLPGQRKDVTWVSRLQCVQTAIEKQIETLCNDNPNAKVGLVCFSNEVTIVGDGIQTPVIIAGDRLYDKNKLIELGSQFRIESTIGEAKSSFLGKMYDLSEGGATALGPAALVAIGIAQNCHTAKIVIATDGLSNIGVGSMEGMVSETELQQVANFYTETALYAQSKGITISVISIAGEQVNMEQLGRLADQTQGDVNIVDPVKLTTEFSDILASKLIATNVEATFYLHRGLGFSDLNNEDVHNLANNCVTRIVGNAYEETELTFEFVVKDTIVNVESLPFQVLIKYTLPSGLEGLRVITQSKETTEKREEAEAEIDLGIMGMHNNWRSAKLAEEGNYDQVYENNLAVQNLMHRNVRDEFDGFTYNNYANDSKVINSQSRSEQVSLNNTQQRFDSTSNTIYQFKNRKRNAQQYKKKK